MSAPGKPKLIERHIAVLKAMEGKKVEAGWFESDRYGATGDNSIGVSVAKIARINEFGATVKPRQVAAGSTTIYRSLDSDGNLLNGGRFVKKSKSNFASNHAVPAHEIPSITIPARPFMRGAWIKFRSDRQKIQSKIAKKIIDKNLTAEQALGQIGLALEGYIAESIRDGGWTQNATSTIARKGFDKPLIDTGHMFKTVNSKVS